jgi:signal transduction histidine kinase
MSPGFPATASTRVCPPADPAYPARRTGTPSAARTPGPVRRPYPGRMDRLGPRTAPLARAWRALAAPPGWLVDAGIAVALVWLTVGLDHEYLDGNPKLDSLAGGHAAWLAQIQWWWAATAVAAIAVALRRLAPLPTFAAALAAAAAHFAGAAVLLPATPVDVAAPLTLYTVAMTARRPLMSRLALAAALLVAVPVAYWYQSPWGSWGGPLLPPILLALAWFAGDAARARHAHLAGLEQRAAALARERDQQAELAAAAERARIARELHDAVAHALAVIVLQAQAATSSLRSRPERSEQALAAITSSGRTAMGEVRRLLGMYRPDGGEQLAPLPDLGDLDALLHRVRDAGLPVTARVAGTLDDLPAGVTRSAYRIVQEALTNTLRHGGAGATAQVRVDRELASLSITVADTGASLPSWVPGNGVRGIRERVTALGGTLHIGQDVDGGFTVKARLPLDAP